jgi:hypothetical protein
MNTKNSFIVVLVIFSMFCFAFFSIHAKASEDSVNKPNRIDPVADAYIQSSYPDENKGEDIVLAVKNRYGSSMVFLKFDLSSIPMDATIRSAKLMLHTYPHSDEWEIHAHYVDDDLWDEDSITYNNCPTSISNRTKDAIKVSRDSWGYWDITEDVRVASHDDGLLTEVLLCEPTGEDYAVVVFYSKEWRWDDFGPKLEVTYTLPTSPTPTPPPSDMPLWKEILVNKYLRGACIIITAIVTVIGLIIKVRSQPGRKRSY